MKTDGPNRRPCLRAKLGEAACLLLFLTPVYCLCVALAARRGSTALEAGLWASLIAGGATLLAFGVTRLSTPGAAAGALLGIGLRTGVPLLALLFAPQYAPDLVAAGFRGLLLACYLPSLALETLWVIRCLARDKAAADLAKGGSGNPSAATGHLPPTDVTKDSPQAV